jgi:multiple sugar transport system permease protein
MTTSRSHISLLPVYLALGVAAAAFVLPLVWMVSTSIKPETQAVGTSISLLPDPPSSAISQAGDNYASVWRDESINFPLYLRNTLLVALLAVTGMTLSSAIVAYGFARIQFRGRRTWFILMLATMMIPFPVLMGPLFVVFSELGWIGTLKPLWVPAWFGGAFNIFLLRQFFMGIPRELDEAARLDGCSHWGTFWLVIVPLARPALAAVALFHFMYVWNDFLAPLIFVTHRDQFTLALGLQLFQSKAGNTPWNLLMAASTIVTGPVLILFVLARRTFVQGVSGEGIKG